jgi:hypothetical protein
MKNTNNSNILQFKRRAAKTDSAQSASQNLPSAKRLVETLERRGHEFGQDVTQVATELKVTRGFLLQLKSGLRPATTLSDDFTDACAKYLEVSRFKVLMLAERITIYDMFPSPHDAATKEVLDATCANGDVHDALATIAALEHAFEEHRTA